MKNQPPILRASGLKKSFKTKDNNPFLVLDDIDISLYDGEIIAILGKSGSGKSTLLRILSGLSEPNEGDVYWEDQRISGPIKGLSMVFQNFALLPWLTVLQNVMLGLDAYALSEKERMERSLKVIDIVGMDGFESAYPKELSGGMCQRVGFARALVVDPKVILMDEPFSSLDILTAENLRADLLDMWHNRSKNSQLQAILLVTHNIEEAAFLADRILIFSSNPGQVASEIKIDLPHERNEEDPEFRKVVDQIYQHMSQTQLVAKGKGALRKSTPISHKLPNTSISELLGVIEALESAVEGNEPIDLAGFGEENGLDVDELFDTLETMDILDFAHTKKGKIKLSSEGVDFINADILGRKEIFARQLLTHVELALHIRKKIEQSPNHFIELKDIAEGLHQFYSDEVITELLDTIIEWGRYAEIFEYDADSQQFKIQ